MKNPLMLALIAMLCIHAHAQTLDTSYPAVVTANSAATGAILLSDGKYILYGGFGILNGVKKPGVVKFNADGSVDNTFGTGTGPNGSISSAALQPDGKILLAGWFTSFNGVNRTFIVRLNADGTVDNTFTPDITLSQAGVSIHMRLQGDGKILVVGPFMTINGVNITSAFARLNADGSRDASFTPPTNSGIRDIAIQPDGKVLVIGTFSKGIARLNANGSGDPTFNAGTGFGGTPSAIEVSATGQIFVGGFLSSFNGTAIAHLACLTSTGALDATWLGNGKPNASVQDLSLQSDGKLLVAGGFTTYGGTAAKAPWRLNADGSRDATLNVGTGSNSTIGKITANASGEILIMGSFTNFNGEARNNIAAMQANGTLKPMTVQPNFQESTWVRAVKAQGADKFLIGHMGNEVNGEVSKGLARLNLNGTTDATFNGNGKPNDYVNAITIDHEGKILIGGHFTSYNGTTTGKFARLSASGDLEASFTINNGTGFNNPPNIIVEQPDGKILVGGSFSNFNGTLRSLIARLNADGTLDATFNTVNGFVTSAGPMVVHDVELLADGKILVAGEFTSFNGNSVKNLLRLNADGSFDNTFLIGAGVYYSGGPVPSVEDVLVLPSGKILIGGVFNSIGASTFNCSSLALLSSNGALENGYLSSNFFGIEQLEKQSDGKIIVMDRNTGLRRLNADATIDGTFTGISAENWIDGIALFGNTMIVGGWLHKVEGQLVQGVAKIQLPAAAPTAPISLATTAVAQTSINLSWTHTGTTETGFFLERSIGNNTNFQVIATLAANVTTYNNTGLTANTQYYYRLRAFNATGNSAYSNELNTTTLMTPPAGPSNLVLAIITAAELKLTWTDNSSNESGFEIYRSVTNNTSYSLLTTTSANATTYSDLTVTLGTTYFYKVRAVNNGGPSGYTTERSAIPAHPTPPSNFGLTVLNAGQIRLAWTDNSSNESGFEIHRSVANNTSYALLTTTSANANTYTDATVTEGTFYFYKIRAVNNGGASSFAAEMSATAANPIPAAPTNLQATGQQGNRVNLSWIDNSNNETGFEIERAEGVGAFQLIHTSASNVTSYSDLTVTHSITYKYRVRSKFGASKSSYTAQVTVVPPPPFPSAPTNLVLTAITSTSIKLTWTDNASDEVDFIIERSLSNNTSYSQLAIISANSIQYTDAAVNPGSTYYYRIKARNSFGASSSIEASLTAGNFTMGNKSIQACQGSLFDSGLNGNYSNNENYTLYIRPATAGSSVQLIFSSFSTDAADQLKIYNGITTNIDSLIGTYSATTSPGTVRATNGLGALTLVFQSNSTTVSSGWNATISCGIFPAIPGNVQLTVPHASEVKISWADNTSQETGYVVERSLTGPSSDFTNIATLAANTTSYSDNTVVANTTYYYRVKAKGPSTDSDFAQVQGIAFSDGGIWRLKKEFDGIARTDAVGFALDGKGYIGLGWAGGVQAANFRSYNSTKDSWSTLASFGGIVRSEAAAFVIGSKAYVGTGEWLDRENDLWEYDPSADTWTAKSDFGGAARTGAIGFSIGDKGYIGLGRTDAAYAKDFWKFDPAGNNWTPVAPFPGDARDGAVVFVIGNFAYAGTGYNGTTRLKDFYKYDPATNAWTAIAAFPGVARRHAVAFSIDGKGYIGTGDSGSDRKDFWSYDPTTDSWQQIVNFGGTARSVATAFAMNGKGYVGTGFDGGNKKDLWEFTPASIVSAPVAPSALTATTNSSSKIDLQWADNSTNENGFVIERSLADATNFQVLTTLPANSTSYSDTGLNPATTYYYRVKITTPVGSSAFTSNASTATLPSPPAAATNLAATLGLGLQALLTWNDIANNETGYTIERAVTANTNFSTLTTLGAGVTSYTDGTVSYASTYYYRVKSTNAGGSSEYSNEATITTGAPPITAPSGLLVEAMTFSSIRLRWKDNSNNETSFNILRATSATGAFARVAVSNMNTTEYVDQNLQENTTYYYKVEAFSAVLGSAVPTDVASATTLKRIPAAPTNLTASYDATSDNITLQWVDASDNEESFVIEKSVAGAAFTSLATVTGTVYTDENPGTTFRVSYRVAAKNSGGMSAFSNVAQIVITGIEPGAAISEVKTYPNPVVDKIVVEWSTPDRGEVEITFFDLSGRTVKIMKYDKTNQVLREQVGLEGITGNAILMMRLAIGKKIITKKLFLK